MKKVKHSITKQYVLIFSILFFCIIFFICFVNALLLGKFYTYNKKGILVDVYNRIDAVEQKDDLENGSFETEFRRIASTYNLDIVIFNSDMEIVISTNPETKMTEKRILDYIFQKQSDENIVVQTSKYQILTSRDSITNLEFIELWGMLSDDHIISIRSSMDSIRQSVRIANRFIVFLSILGFLICIFIIVAVTHRITKPIMNLVNISERMTKLDFNAKYKPLRSWTTEVDVLGSYINKLSSTLESTISDLKSANVKLMSDIEEKTEIENRRKEFVANVSHELKTPIAIIQGYAEGLKDCVNDDAESRDFYCDVIIDESQKMNKLVKNLLELDQIESGAGETVIERFDLIEVIYNCAASMELICRQNDIKLILPDKRIIMVWSDEFKIEQIINNYLSNAIHYVSGNKVIRISTEIKDSRVRVGVYNSGNPIPEESLEHLWTKFYKVDKARTREYGGSGIGLSIVKAIMDTLGQKCGVENLEDGVEFWFEVDCSNEVV